MSKVRGVKVEWLPFFEAFTATGELEKEYFFLLKFLAVCVSFARICPTARECFGTGEYAEL